MFNQCIGRFEMMAVSGSFWQEAERDIETLREKLQYAVDNKLLQINDLSMRKRNVGSVLKGAQGIYLYCVNAFQKMVQPIAEIFDKIEKQQVVIFGVGKFGRFFMHFWKPNIWFWQYLIAIINRNYGTLWYKG